MNENASWNRLTIAAAGLALLGLAAGCEDSAATRATETPVLEPTESVSEQLDQRIDALTEAVRADPSNEIPITALVGLQELGLPAVRELFADPDEFVRVAAVAIVKEITAPESLDLMIAALGDPNEDVRLETVEAIGEWRSNRAAPGLIALYSTEDDDQVRYEILTTLGRIGNPEALPLLESGTTDEDRYVRMWSVSALCDMNAATAATHATRMLDDPDRYVRLRVLADCPNHLVTPAGIKRVAAKFVTPEDLPEFAGARGIVRRQLNGADADAVKKAVRERALGELDGENRAFAALALAEIDDRRALPGLESTVQDATDPIVRHNAAYHLGRLGDASVVPVLIVLLDDPGPLVSGTAHDALLGFAEGGNEDAKAAVASYTGVKLPRLRDLDPNKR